MTMRKVRNSIDFPVTHYISLGQLTSSTLTLPLSEINIELVTDSDLLFCSIFGLL